MTLKPPTKAEQAWMDAITRIGCIVCIRLDWGPTPAEMHHILGDGGRKLSHLLTLPLCMSHHRGSVNTVHFVSRHPWRLEFERRYGTEMDMHAEVVERVGRMMELAV